MIELIPRPRSFQKEGDNNEALWLVCYSDLVTNIMLFFLVMWILQVMENSKERVQALQEAFGGEAPSVEEAKARAEQAQQKAREEAVAESLSELGAVTVSQSFVRLSLPGPILFGFADDRLSPEGRGVLAAVAEKLRSLPNEVIVEGHTDSVRVTGGPFRDNIQLSMARAHAVIDHLAGVGKVPLERLIGTGYGPSRPVAPNDSNEGRRRNRRVEIVVVRRTAETEGSAPAEKSVPRPAGAEVGPSPGG